MLKERVHTMEKIIRVGRKKRNIIILNGGRSIHAHTLLLLLLLQHTLPLEPSLPPFENTLSVYITLIILDSSVRRAPEPAASLQFLVYVHN